MMRAAGTRFLTMLLAVALLTTGCSWRAFWTTLGLAGAAGVGAAAVYYSKGDLEADFDDDIRDVYDASKTTLERKGYDIDEDRVNNDEGLITGKTDDGDRFRLSLNEREGNNTRMKIRIGTIGDESKSRDLHDDIRDELQNMRRGGVLKGESSTTRDAGTTSGTTTPGTTTTVTPIPTPAPG
jgi:hypothetical protein